MRLDKNGQVIRFLTEKPWFSKVPLTQGRCKEPNYNFCHFSGDMIGCAIMTGLVYFIGLGVLLLGIPAWVVVFSGSAPLVTSSTPGISGFVLTLFVFLASALAIFGSGALIYFGLRKIGLHRILPDWHFPGAFGEVYRGLKDRFCPIITVE